MSSAGVGARVAAAPLRRTLVDPPLLLRAEAGLDGFLDRLEAIAPPAARTVAAQLGLRDPADVEIIVLHAPTFRAWARGFAPEWGVGVALWPVGPIVLDAAATTRGSKPLKVIVQHELAHVYLGQRVGGEWLPRWLVEGLAQQQAGEWGWTDTFALVRAAALGRLPALARLERGFPAAGSAAQQAYALSVHAVGQLERRLGAAGWPPLLDDLRAGVDLDAALLRHAGVGLEEFDRRTVEGLRGRFGWLGLLASLPNLFTIMTVLFLAAVVRAYVRRRRRLMELAREEALLSPAAVEGETDRGPEAPGEDTRDPPPEPRSTDRFSR